MQTRPRRRGCPSWSGSPFVSLPRVATAQRGGDVRQAVKRWPVTRPALPSMVWRGGIRASAVCSPGSGTGGASGRHVQDPHARGEPPASGQTTAEHVGPGPFPAGCGSRRRGARRCRSMRLPAAVHVSSTCTPPRRPRGGASERRRATVCGSVHGSAFVVQQRLAGVELAPAGLPARRWWRGRFGQARGRVVVDALAAVCAQALQRHHPFDHVVEAPPEHPAARGAARRS